MNETACCIRSRTAVSIFVRWRKSRSACQQKQQGFSLPETLTALLLFSISSLALVQYQLALGRGFQLQLQQREAFRLAWQRFEGYQAPNWQTALQQTAIIDGCELLTSTVVSPAGAKASLSQLLCKDQEAESRATQTAL
ncbi:prepilin-type N-terminal cleavage/methylation domain-containing protein [Kalamiella sp. sgz302252]|uniref:prepilin-type N-terminal cleavage/methylation domain-containing protein n=1 Tax=Pantoea sp. sgz302252 TaxID=3341827 RepID=UPI0036D410F8